LLDPRQSIDEVRNQVSDASQIEASVGPVLAI
jgi:hypothetical protein